MSTLSKRIDALEAQMRSVQASLPRGLNFGAFVDSSIAIMPLSDGSLLVMPKSAPHRIVRRAEPVIFGGDPLREARELSRIGAELVRAVAELDEKAAT